MADKEVGDLADGGAAAEGDHVHAVRAGNSRDVTLGDAAGKSTGTSAGTVAAGDDSRITGAIQASVLTARGQMIRRGVSAPEAFAKGTQYQVVQAGANDPEYGPVALNQPAAISGELPGGNMAAASTSSKGAVEEALDAEVAAATANKSLHAGHLNSAAAYYALSDASPVAVPWNAFAANAVVTVTANRQIGNPTNEIPGQWRVILVKGNNTTDRTITFGSEFLGELPAIADCDDTTWYEITIHCVAVSHFTASAKKVKG